MVKAEQDRKQEDREKAACTHRRERVSEALAPSRVLWMEVSL